MWPQGAVGSRGLLPRSPGPGCVRCLGEFGDEGELPLLAGRPRWRCAKQGRDARLVVGKQAESAPLQQKPEMSDRAEGGQQLSVEGGVPGARPRQLLRVERQWLPSPAGQLL